METHQRALLLKACMEQRPSLSTQEKISQVIKNSRETKGHNEAEAKAKEIRLLMETGIRETELLKKLNQMR